MPAGGRTNSATPQSPRLGVYETRPMVRPWGLNSRGESVPSGLVSSTGEDPGLRRSSLRSSRLHPWARSSGPPLQGSWERPLHNTDARLPTPPKGRRPRKRLSPSQPRCRARETEKKTVPFSTAVSGSSGRLKIRSSLVLSRLSFIGTRGSVEDFSQSPERAATPRTAQGTGVERPRDAGTLGMGQSQL